MNTSSSSSSSVVLNTQNLKILKDAFSQLTDIFLLEESYRAQKKEIIEEVAEKLNIPKKTISKLARLHYKSKAKETFEETEEMQEIYQELYGL